jgi:hypothetical protein
VTRYMKKFLPPCNVMKSAHLRLIPAVSLLCHCCVTAVSLLCHCCVIAVSLLCHCCVIAVSLLCHCCADTATFPWVNALAAFYKADDSLD